MQGEASAVSASEETFMKTNDTKKHLKRERFKILHAGNKFHIIYMGFGLYHKK
jgi:hypothetical protein